MHKQMKQIKLKESTKKRIEDLQAKSQQINAVINDMILTVLEHEEVNISEYNINYDNGVINLNKKK